MSYSRRTPGFGRATLEPWLWLGWYLAGICSKENINQSEQAIKRMNRFPSNRNAQHSSSHSTELLLTV